MLVYVGLVLAVGCACVAVFPVFHCGFLSWEGEKQAQLINDWVDGLRLPKKPKNSLFLKGYMRDNLLRKEIRNGFFVMAIAVQTQNRLSSHAPKNRNFNAELLHFFGWKSKFLLG
jgi:hypothetical protein